MQSRPLWTVCHVSYHIQRVCFPIELLKVKGRLLRNSNIEQCRMTSFNIAAKQTWPLRKAKLTTSKRCHLKELVKIHMYKTICHLSKQPLMVLKEDSKISNFYCVDHSICWMCVPQLQFLSKTTRKIIGRRWHLCSLKYCCPHEYTS